MSDKDLATIGISVDTSQLKKGEKSLEDFAKKGGVADKAVDNFEKSMSSAGGQAAKAAKGIDQASKSMAGVSRGAGQAGIQVQQFVGQVQAGQDPMLAFSQQAADIGIVLGAPMVGAVLGIAGAIGGALLPSLFSAGKETEKLVEKIKELKGEIQVTGAQSAFLASQADKNSTALAKENEKIADQIRLLNERIELMTTAGTGIDTGNFAIPRSAEENVKRYGEAIKGARLELEELTAKLDTNNAQIKLNAGEMQRLSRESDGLTESERDLVKALETELIALEKGEEAAKLHAIALSLGKESAKDLKPAITDLVSSIEEKTKAEKLAQEVERESTRQAKEQERQLKITERSVDSIVRSLDMQRMQLTMTNDQFEEYQAVQRAIASGATPAMIAVVRESVKALQEQRKAVDNVSASLDQFFDDDSIFGKTADEIESVTEKTDEWMQITERAADSIDQAFVDVWENIGDGFDSLTDGIENAFKRMLAEMAHQALTRPIVLNIQQSLSGGGLGGILSGGGNLLGGLGGLVGQGIGGAGNLLGGLGLTGLGSSLGMFGGAFGASSAMLAGGQFGAAGAFASNLLGAGSLSGALGAALPIAGVAVVAGKVVSDVLGLGSNWKLAEQKVTVEIVGDDFSGEVTTREKRKKLFKNRYRESSTEIADEAFDALFGDLTSQIAMWGDKLGMSGDEIQSFFDNFSASLEFDAKGLSEEEVQQKINEFVTSTSDAMIKGVFGDFAEGLEQRGETTAQTVVRLISTFETFDAISKQLGLNFDATGKEAITAAANIADMTGGISNLASASSNLIGFADFGDRISMAIKGFSGVFGTEIDANMPQTRAAFFDLAQSLDLTTTAGQEAYATLLRISPAIGEYYDLQEQSQQEWFNLRVRLLRAQGKEEEALAMIRERTLEQTRDGLKWMTEEVMKAEELAKQREEAARIEEKRTDLEIQLLELQGKAEEALALSRQKQLDALDPALHATMEMIFAEQDLAQARQNEKARLDELYSTLTSNLNFAESQVESARSAELERISLLESKAQDRFNAEVRAIEEAGRMQERIYSNQKSALQDQLSLVSSIARQYGADSAGVSVEQALAAARQGNFAPAQNISTGGNYTSAVDMRIGQAREAFALAEIGKLADQEQSSLERQMSAVDRQISAINSGSEAQIEILQKQLDEDLKAYQEQKDALNKQVDELLGIDRSVISLEEATALYQKAQQDLLELDYDNQIAALEQLTDQSMLQEQILSNSSDQITLLNDVNSSLVSMNNYLKQPPIITIPREPTTKQDDSKEVAEMQRQIKNATEAMAKYTQRSAKILQRIESDGLPTQ